MDQLSARFPVTRPRWLRSSAALRDFVAQTSLATTRWVLPLFVRPGKNLRKPVGSMPGVFQLSPDEIVREAETALKAGVKAVMLFGIPDAKDEQASGAYAENGIVQQTVRLLKRPARIARDHRCLPLRIHEPRPLRHCGSAAATRPTS